MVNFRQPYLSQRLQEFWRRWHISLSSWLRVISTFRWRQRGRGVENFPEPDCHMILAGCGTGKLDLRHFGAIHGVVLSLERLFSSREGAAMRSSPGLYPVPFHLGQRILTSTCFA